MSDVVRGDGGTFAAGHSGNPGGRPALTEEQKAKRRAIKELAQEHSTELFEVVLELATNKKEKGGVRFKAAKYLLDQAWGAPAVVPTTEPQGAPQTVAFVQMTPERFAEVQAEQAEKARGDNDAEG